MRFFFTFFFLLNAFSVFAQQLITGAVQDEKGAPITYASVFLNNTSIGTKANSEGKFELQIPAGRFELIVSSIGYQTYSQYITAATATAPLRIVLKIKTEELEAIVIEPYEKNGWEKWGRWFTENFIGTSKYAGNCRIKNPEVLRFRHSRKNNELKVRALAPLVIENKDLGYQLTYQLEDFHYDFKTRYLFYAGYPFFQPMEGNEKKQRKWAEARKDVYYGSLMHFMRSLYRNQLRQEGFEVRSMQKQPNLEKQRVQQAMRKEIQFGGGSMTVIQPPQDSSDYYRQVMQQEDFTRIIGKDVLPGDSIAYAIDSTTAGLEFDNYLLIHYTRKAAAKEFVALFPKSGGQHLSELFLLNGNPVAVIASGAHFLPNDLLSSGYWAWSEKMATMLPFDYKVEAASSK